MALMTAITVTPTSAKTASHIGAIPKAPRMRNRPFAPRAKRIFCQKMRRVSLDTCMAVSNLESLSPRLTTSADLIAAFLVNLIEADLPSPLVQIIGLIMFE